LFINYSRALIDDARSASLAAEEGGEIIETLAVRRDACINNSVVSETSELHMNYLRRASARLVVINIIIIDHSYTFTLDARDKNQRASECAARRSRFFDRSYTREIAKDCLVSPEERH
jgi:hypothetical protein